MRSVVYLTELGIIRPANAHFCGQLRIVSFSAVTQNITIIFTSSNTNVNSQTVITAGPN